MADVGDHPAAVQRELEPQLWSTKQPWFAERLAALKAKISSARMPAPIAHNCHMAGVNSASTRPLVLETRGGATTT